FGQLDPDLVESLTPITIGLVGDRRAQHPEGDRLAVDGCLEARLEGRDPLRVLAGSLAEIALGGEPPELADSAVAVGGLSERLRLLELGELAVALVDRLQVERLLQPGVVEVELLVELCDEPIGLAAEMLELCGGERGSCARHRP